MRIGTLCRGLRWYLRELTGESQYEHYLRRHGQLEPGGPPLSRAEFERRRTDRGDEHPGARCC